MLHSVMPQSKVSKIQNCLQTSRQAWIHLLKIISLLFVPGKYHYGVFNVF